MKSNEFKINKFSGVVNSVVNPDPRTSAKVNNFDVYSIEGALQTRRGIKKYFDINLTHLPTIPTRMDYIGFCTYYSEEHNQEFNIVLVNKEIDNIKYCSINTYPSFKKVNGQYVIDYNWSEVNQFAIYVVDDFRYEGEVRMLHILPLYGSFENVNNSFLYWTALIVDSATHKVKNVFYVSREHYYSNNLANVVMAIDDDYNIVGGDTIIFVKNFVKVKNKLFGNVEDYYGIIPQIENPKFVVNDTGVNILSTNLETLKLCLDFNKIEHTYFSLNQVFDTNNVIKDANFENFVGFWNSLGNIERTKIENRSVVKFLKGGDSYISQNFTVPENGYYEIFIEIMYSAPNPASAVGEFYVSIKDVTNNSYAFGKKIIQNPPPSGFTFRTEQADKWYRIYVGSAGLSKDFTYKIELDSKSSDGEIEFYVSTIKLNRSSKRVNLLQIDNFDNSFYAPNEFLGNNGFYVTEIVPDLLSDEDMGKTIRPFYGYFFFIKEDMILKPSNRNLMAERIIATLNNTNELCVLQRKRTEEYTELISTLNRAIYVNYKLLNRRINELTAFYSYNTFVDINLNYHQLAFYKAQRPKFQYAYLDGRIEFLYSIKLEDKTTELTNYLGYEAGEPIIKKWSIQENNYIADCEVDRKYRNTIFYSAINGNGVIMNDIYPLGNAIQIPYEGGSISELKINRLKYLFVIKNNAVYLLDLDTYMIIKLSLVDGLSSRYGCASDGNNIFWADIDGVKATDGSRVINLTKNINNNDYLALDRSNVISYINLNYNCLELIFDGNYVIVYPLENPFFNYKKTLPFICKYVNTNINGDTLYLTNTGKIMYQTPINNDFYADENSVEALEYETNEFNIINLDDSLPVHTRISVNEIFIDYVSRSELYIELIGDGEYVSQYFIPSSIERKLLRFQYAGGNQKNLFKSIKLRIIRAPYNGGNFEHLAYTRIYAIGFTWLPQQITRQFNEIK